MPHVEIRQCVDSACRFRYPWTEHDPAARRCPRCGELAETVFSQSRATENRPQTAHATTRAPLFALLDNLRSAFNVGSIFRCADGAGVQHLYLCGATPTPQHPKLIKTALGAEQTVAWSYHTNALDLVLGLKQQDISLWALETNERAESLFCASDLSPHRPTFLVVGSEVTGVDPEVLTHCERVLSLPMFGSKRSLNVAIAFGIAIYTLRFAQFHQ
jgi:tRNA G18 (ribose-2'-O)-methylase SpoU